MSKSRLQNVLESQLWYRVVSMKENNVMWLTGAYDTKEMAETDYIDLKIYEWKSLPIMGIKNAQEVLDEWERIVKLPVKNVNELDPPCMGIDKLYSDETKALAKRGLDESMITHKRQLFKPDLTPGYRGMALQLIDKKLDDNLRKIKGVFEKEVYRTNWNISANVFFHEHNKGAEV